MKRRSFLRTSLAAAAAPGLIAMPAAGQPAPSGRLRPQNGPIRLSSNENPLGIPESAAAAIRAGIAGANRYPDSGASLREAIARKHDVRSSNVILGAGSTDVLRMVAQAIGVSPTARLIVPEPTFEHVEQYAAPYIHDIVRVPLRADHAIDIDAMQAASSRARGEVLMYLCNPNNPTATITPVDELEAWVRRSTEKFFFLVDEAYFDYVDDPAYRTMVPLANRPNLIVTRTFSKIYGLAGMRLGYGITIPETVGRLAEFRLNNNASNLAQAAALACIDDDAFIRRSIESNREARAIALEALQELDLEVLPGHANFLMHRIRGNVDQYRDRMRDFNVLVGRPFPPMLQYSRLSIGTPAEMEQWAGALREFRGRGWV